MVCKGRFYQDELYKFRSLNGEIVQNLGNARSFYICVICIKKDAKELRKPLTKFGKKKPSYNQGGGSGITSYTVNRTDGDMTLYPVWDKQ